MTNIKPIPKNEVRSRNKIEQHEHCDQADARRVKIVDQYGDAINSTNPLPVDAIINLSATKPDTNEIINKLVTSAATEVFVTLPAKTEIIEIYVRNTSGKAISLQYTFTPGESGTKYRTVTPGSTKKIEGLSFDVAQNLYFQLNSVDPGGTIVEIETWRN